MSPRTSQQFGGSWTQEKLDVLHKYLTPYAKIMSKQKFHFAYIDAFAGTGYRETPKKPSPMAMMFPDLVSQESDLLLQGSARIALQVQPLFDKYIFIEAATQRCEELFKLRDEFPELAGRISIVNEDCNSWLQERCLNFKWESHRAVLFLDPFGMQVEWSTMEAIAKTQAIDVWILFPVGVAVNRLLKRDGEIEPTWSSALDRLFGTNDWFEVFYEGRLENGMFGKMKSTRKKGNFESISAYYIQRLKSIFPPGGVAESPRPLCNSKGVPLYALCFAAGNPKGGPLAVKIAGHILKGWPHGTKK